MSEQAKTRTARHISQVFHHERCRYLPKQPVSRDSVSSCLSFEARFHSFVPLLSKLLDSFGALGSASSLSICLDIEAARRDERFLERRLSSRSVAKAAKVFVRLCI